MSCPEESKLEGKNCEREESEDSKKKSSKNSHTKSHQKYKDKSFDDKQAEKDKKSSSSKSCKSWNSKRDRDKYCKSSSRSRSRSRSKSRDRDRKRRRSSRSRSPHSRHRYSRSDRERERERDRYGRDHDDGSRDRDGRSRRYERSKRYNSRSRSPSYCHSSVDQKKRIKNNKTSSRNKDGRFLRVVFLGTSSAQPIPLKRNVSSLVIQTSTGNLSMVDCGEGTQHQFKLSTLKIGKLRNIFITHLHGDHCYGLFGLLHSIRNEENNDFTLNIYGPRGIKKMINTTLSLSGGLYHYKLNIVELDDIDNNNNNNNNKQQLFTRNDIIDIGEIETGIRCIACRITHRLETFGYIFIENNQIGKLNAEKAISMGAKGKQLGLLKNGNDVKLENGTIIYSKDVVGNEIIGNKIGIMQDCSDCRSCFKIAQNIDLFIHECTYDEKHKLQAIPRGHSTAKMAALNAVKINAKMLMLTHFSSRFVECGIADNEMKEDDDIDDDDDDLMHVQRLQKEAEEEIENNKSKCIVRCAADFMSIRFGKNKQIIIDKELALTQTKKQHFQHDLPYLKLICDQN